MNHIWNQRITIRFFSSWMTSRSREKKNHQLIMISCHVVIVHLIIMIRALTKFIIPNARSHWIEKGFRSFSSFSIHCFFLSSFKLLPLISSLRLSTSIHIYVYIFGSIDWRVHTHSILFSFISTLSFFSSIVFIYTLH